MELQCSLTLPGHFHPNQPKKIPFENPCKVSSAQKYVSICRHLEIGSWDLRRNLWWLYIKLAGDLESLLPRKLHRLPHLLMAAWWTSRGTPALSCKSFYRNAGWLLRYFSVISQAFPPESSGAPENCRCAVSKPLIFFLSGKRVWRPFPHFHA